MNQASTERVSRVVWPWRQDGVGSTVNAVLQRRKRCGLEALLMCTAGTVILLWKQHVLSATVLYCMAGLFLVTGLFMPPVYSVLKWLVEHLVRVLSVAVAWLLLAPFFYVCFTFGRVMLLLKGKDPLCRKCPTDQKTYWMARPKPQEGTEHFKRQY